MVIIVMESILSLHMNRIIYIINASQYAIYFIEFISKNI